ncbi:PepSY domain-containing protein [Sphingomonas sp. IW22]|uniref:PepSY domain-containing protein n=1 Tax=Sphingomonas sp. IW22 TaxID=3242489 RepID=UPI0035219034
MEMKGLGVLVAFASAVAGVPSIAVGAQQRDDHRAARAARVEGRILPLREIERRVVPRMRGARYLGFDFDSGTTVYTLKFLRDGNVIWVDVDGRSGQVLSRSGD